MCMSLIHLLIIIVCSFFVVTFIHELGHWFFGLFCGYQFNQLILGPLIIKKNGIKLLSKSQLSLSGGVITLEIKNINQLSRTGYIIMILGGPLTSFIFGIMMFVMYAYIRHLAIFALAAMSLSIGISTLIPLRKRSGFHYTDGKTALEIIKNEIHGKNEYNLLFLVQCYLKNIHEEREQEIITKLKYMVINRVDTDVVYIILALTFMLDTGIYLFPKDDIVQQITDITERANQFERKWIASVMKEYA